MTTHDDHTPIPGWALATNLTGRDFRIYMLLWTHTAQWGEVTCPSCNTSFYPDGPLIEIDDPTVTEITTDVEKAIADALGTPFGKVREAILKFTDLGLVVNRDTDTGTRGAFLVLDEPDEQ